MVSRKSEKKKVRRVSRLETWGIDRCRLDPRNARLHPEQDEHFIDASLMRFGQTWPLLVQPNGLIVAGHWRWKRMKALGWAEVNVLVIEGWSQADIHAYMVADNQLATLSENDLPKLKEQLAVMMARDGKESADSLGFTQDQINQMVNPVASTGVAGSLAAKFGIPPFSVMNAREGWWQMRKGAWLKLGIQSELGRGGELIPRGGAYQENRGAAGTGAYSRMKKGKTADGAKDRSAARKQHKGGGSESSGTRARSPAP